MFKSLLTRGLQQKKTFVVRDQFHYRIRHAFHLSLLVYAFLLCSMLAYDPTDRPTALQLLQSPFFADVRKEEEDRAAAWALKFGPGKTRSADDVRAGPLVDHLIHFTATVHRPHPPAPRQTSHGGAFLRANNVPKRVRFGEDSEEKNQEVAEELLGMAAAPQAELIVSMDAPFRPRKRGAAAMDAPEMDAPSPKRPVVRRECDAAVGVAGSYV
eukprot:GHVT01060618.1.p1 GENE.GHVT01060618.1~~GHVT01060618.1.p1  ORF type:complete len:213 (-),score=33.79 GHVT01060618.1:32-670(-)